jgi:hypothetical protein
MVAGQPTEAFGSGTTKSSSGSPLLPTNHLNRTAAPAVFRGPLKSCRVALRTAVTLGHLRSRLLVLPEQGGPIPTALQTPLNFPHPNFAMMFKSAGPDVGPSWFCTSMDRGRTWQPPCEFNVPGLDRIAARTENVPHRVMLSLELRRLIDPDVLRSRWRDYD